MKDFFHKKVIALSFWKCIIQNLTIKRPTQNVETIMVFHSSINGDLFKEMVSKMAT